MRNYFDRLIPHSKNRAKNRREFSNKTVNIDYRRVIDTSLIDITIKINSLNFIRVQMRYP